MKARKCKSKRRQKKQRIESEEDRISLLPDCLLVDIISRLPETKEAIRTGALSKRWLHLWPQVHNLSFIYDVRDDHRGGFYDDRIANSFLFFEKTLTQRGQSDIHKFKLHCSYNDETESLLNNCISYAINNNAKEFDFKVFNYLDGCDIVLPQTFFTSSCFGHLRMSEYSFDDRATGVISWKNLRTLCLKRSEFGDSLLQNILSGSPLLETLELANCFGPPRIDISNKSVKNLVLSFGNDEDDCLGYFEVNAPHISSLTIQQPSMFENLLLLNVSSVIKSELNYSTELYHEDLEPSEEILRGLILSLDHAKEIKIGKLCLEALTRLKAKGFIYPSNLKILEDIDSN